MSEIINLIWITLLPFLELRASIPYGIFSTNLHWLTVFLICVITNIILAPIIYFLLDNFVHLFIRIKFIDRIYQKIVVRTQRKVHKSVEKYGVLGLALFIGVPLPGSGVYSGALAAYLLGFRKRDFFLAAVIGVLIAGIIVLLVSLLGNGAWDIFVKSVELV
ncbi:small multi-drug export protein [Candidatus Woesearchaeota archaeon]|jgi:uncharacterized membrane protein|nr:small multi-drug export protein [Candidatus Woesearchaeota archaeon]MBT4111066.1 small multi-drug export protein [Candidatus Woesearchaeota archaeon]MBT4336935.1 small multi-drug export protein [Candidatus Woesearchaeota archaeon]MBT4469750.1 small multi-drug export protein [Candidatus Woesearchaeota archaeon]MBT6743779.1 small multi-drug export protein [Candidatus Woesearchaeota archaeon]